MGLYSDPELSDEEFRQRILGNFRLSLDYKFQYFFACNIICLITRIISMLYFTETIGPLLKILGKMSQDVFNFFILYSILTVMFAIIGNQIFIYDLDHFFGLINSVLSVVDSSLGNFGPEIFESV